jgi:hypothetical protein
MRIIMENGKKLGYNIFHYGQTSFIHFHWDNCRIVGDEKMVNNFWPFFYGFHQLKKQI